MDYKEYFKKRNLLTDGKSNTKTAKNGIKTYYLSLQPHKLNSKGVNLCKFSTKECREMCLSKSGRQGFSNVELSRQRKTEFYINHPSEFLTKLWEELNNLNSKSEKVAIRLNLLSDIDWELEFATIINKDIAKLKNIQFYDYTKSHLKAISNQVKNYHLTLSFSGSNWKQCENYLQKGGNVAVVYKNGLPISYNSYKVVNGDESDARFLDPKGVIIGLKYKIPRGVKYTKNKFIIEI